MYPYSAGAYGGLLGGLAMIPVALIYGLLSGHSIRYPVNLIAATLLRGWQQVSPEQLTRFSAAGLILGLAIHISVSATLGLPFAVLLPTLPGRPLLGQVWSFSHPQHTRATGDTIHISGRACVLGGCHLW